MKPVNDPLNRLLKAAAAAPRPGAGAARFILEARVLGSWRMPSSAETGEMLLVWMRRAVIAACVLALATLAWDYGQFTDRSGDEFAVADLAMRMGVE